MSRTHIPLWKGGSIVGYALVDETDYERLSLHRWRPASGGYAQRGVRVVLMHRDVLGEPPFDGAEADHINRNKLDNRRTNLRWVTRAQNRQNRGAQRNNRCGVTCVYQDTDGHWRGRVKQRDGRSVWSGRYRTFDEAATATRAARKRLLPFSIEAAQLTGAERA